MSPMGADILKRQCCDIMLVRHAYHPQGTGLVALLFIKALELCRSPAQLDFFPALDALRLLKRSM